MNPSLRWRKFSDSELIVDQTAIRYQHGTADKNDRVTTLCNIPEANIERKHRRFNSESDYVVRKFSETNLFQNRANRRSSDIGPQRRFSSFSLESNRNSRRQSQNDVIMDATVVKRQTFRSRDSWRTRGSYDGMGSDSTFSLSLSKSKLSKTHSTQNLYSLGALRKLQKIPGKERTIGKYLRRVRSENYVIPAPWKNRILVRMDKSEFFS